MFFTKIFVIGLRIDRPLENMPPSIWPANIAIHFIGVLETDIVGRAEADKNYNAYREGSK